MLRGGPAPYPLFRCMLSVLLSSVCRRLTTLRRATGKPCTASPLNEKGTALCAPSQLPAQRDKELANWTPQPWKRGVALGAQGLGKGAIYT